MEDLVARIRRGDREALVEFVRTHEPFIRARFRAHLESRAGGFLDSSDFFSSVMRRADSALTTRAVDTTGESLELRRLLQRIMVETIDDYARADAAESRLRDGSEHAEPPPPTPKGAEVNVDADRLSKHLNELDRQILRLRSEGMKHSGIASATGLSVAAVRMRWTRIRSKIKSGWSAARS